MAAVLGTPADVVKTRIMNQPRDKQGRYGHFGDFSVGQRDPESLRFHWELVQVLSLALYLVTFLVFQFCVSQGFSWDDHIAVSSYFSGIQSN